MQNNERNVKSDLTRGVQLFEFVTQHYMPCPGVLSGLFSIGTPQQLISTIFRDRCKFSPSFKEAGTWKENTGSHLHKFTIRLGTYLAL